MDDSRPTPPEEPTQPVAQVPPAAYPSGPGGWAPPVAPQGSPQPGSTYPVAPFPVPGSAPPYAYAAPRSTRPGLVLGVISLIISTLALLGVLGLGFMLFAGGPPGGTPLTGRLPVSGAGGSIGATEFSQAIADRMRQDGATVQDMVCPAAPAVERGQVWVCHGQLDGSDWAIVVYVEDSAGSYTLNPI